MRQSPVVTRNRGAFVPPQARTAVGGGIAVGQGGYANRTGGAGGGGSPDGRGGTAGRTGILPTPALNHGGRGGGRGGRGGRGGQAGNRGGDDETAAVGRRRHRKRGSGKKKRKAESESATRTRLLDRFAHTPRGRGTLSDDGSDVSGNGSAQDGRSQGSDVEGLYGGLGSSVSSASSETNYTKQLRGKFNTDVVGANVLDVLDAIQFDAPKLTQKELYELPTTMWQLETKQICMTSLGLVCFVLSQWDVITAEDILTRGGLEGIIERELKQLLETNFQPSPSIGAAMKHFRHFALILVTSVDASVPYYIYKLMKPSMIAFDEAIDTCAGGAEILRGYKDRFTRRTQVEREVSKYPGSISRMMRKATANQVSGAHKKKR